MSAPVASPIISPSLTGTATSTATPTSTLRAAAQGGVIDGLIPTTYNTKDPLTLFIIQAGIIIIFCRLLHWPLSKIRQPRVIAEVIGGILLGPSVMGRIPNFTATIFPTAAMPNLTLVANVGLVLFLFLVGLEVDLRRVLVNWKTAASVGALGMALPFGLGVAVAYGLYHDFPNEEGTVPISFGIFALFIGVAMAITAFPVLCRILSELELLQTPVGVIVLTAGVSNDVVGWILLALCVALVNAGTGITALYVLLATVGFILFLTYAVRPAFIWILRRNGSFENGPSQGIIALTLLMVLASSFFTGIIGVHAIFGAFAIGVICPHEGGFAIKVTEKVEDLVSTILLPLYFTLSGLNTNLGLLNDGLAWGYVVAVIIIAFVAKFVGGALAARGNGLLWRESATIGALMSCKGLVELIVLNIGLSARILSQRTFTIFVVMALVTTFITTPLTAWLYPPWYQKKVEAWRRGEIDWETGSPAEPSERSVDTIAIAKDDQHIKSLLVYLRLDNMPALVAFISLFGGKTAAAARQHPAFSPQTDKAGELDLDPNQRPVDVHGVRLMELTERGSSVMKVSEVDEFSVHDPVVNTFRTVGRLYNLAVSGEVAIGPESAFADMLTTKATEADTDLLLLPWSESGGMHEMQLISNDSEKNKLDSSTYAAFAARALDSAAVNTAVFIDRGFGGSLRSTRAPGISRTISSLSMRSASNANRDNITLPARDKGHHIFMPFFGGADSRAALRLVLQLAENPHITATIVFFEDTTEHDHPEPQSPEPAILPTSPPPTSPTSPSSRDLLPPTLRYSQHTAAAAQTAESRARDSTFFTTLSRALSSNPAVSTRVLMERHPSASPVQDAVLRATAEVGQNPHSGGDMIVLGRHRGWFGRDVSRYGTLGVPAGKIVDAGIGASLLVLQARA